MSKVQTIKVRQDKLKAVLLEQIRRTPIKEIACGKAGISRTTLYRWMKLSNKFAGEIESSLNEGRELINDLAESQVITLIQQGDIAAMRLWLQHNSARYANKLELSGTVTTKDEPMTAAEKILLRKAFKHSSLHGNKTKKTKEK
mgnify:CR=1 FL=1